MTREQPRVDAGNGDDPASDLDHVEALDDVELRRHVAKLTLGLHELTGTVRRMAGAPARDGGTPTSDQDDGTTAGEELVAWVQWLVVRYELDNIPDCWVHHGALVEELDALRIGWLDTIGKGQGGLAAMQWHDLFGRALERFDRRWRAKNCADTHRDTILPTWATGGPAMPRMPTLESDRYQPKGRRSRPATASE